MAGTLQDNAELLLSTIAINALGTVSGGAVAMSGNTTVTISANTTFTFPAAASVPGVKWDLEITQDGTGSRTGTFAVASSGTILFVGGSKTLTTTAGATDKVSAFSDGTQWLCSLNKAYS